MNFKHWLLSNTQIEGMLRHQHVHSEHLIAAVLEVREYRRIHGPLGAECLWVGRCNLARVLHVTPAHIYLSSALATGPARDYSVSRQSTRAERLHNTETASLASAVRLVSAALRMH